jgi:hypothetical protein
MNGLILESAPNEMGPRIQILREVREGIGLLRVAGDNDFERVPQVSAMVATLPCPTEALEKATSQRRGWFAFMK